MTKSATIVGAGIAGLSSAIALAEAGYRVRVLERDQAAASETGLAVTANGLEALAALGMRDRVEREGTRTRMGGIFTQTGTSLMGETETDAGDLVGIHEESLLRILASRADELGVTVQRNTLVRSDADLPESDLIIGADGLRSSVRSWIKPRVRPDYSGATCWYGVAEGAQAAPETVTTWVGRGTEAGILPIDGDRTYWYISSIARQRRGSNVGDTAPAEEAATFASRFDAPLSALVEATDTVVREPLFYLPTGLKRFTSRRTGTPIVLVGDAAHAMVPSLVQGANQALEDAATLRVLLEDIQQDEDPESETLLARFNEERVERAQSLQRKSLCAMQWMQANGPLKGVARNALLKLTPTLAAEIAIGWHGRWLSPNAPR